MSPDEAHARATLAQRQAAVVAALVAGASTPPGFDESAVRASAAALMRKRAGDVAAVWPLLAATLGPQWGERFTAWAAARPTRGALRDGWDFARTLASEPAAAPITATARWAAAAELAEREVRWRYDGRRAPRRRRLPAARRGPGVVAVQLLGRVWLWRKPLAHARPVG